MKSTTGLLGLAAAVAFSTSALGSDKIVGGQEVSPDQQDARQYSTVALTTNIQKSPDKPSPLQSGKSFCTGTILTKRVIVTAAHCLQGMDPNTRQKVPGLILPKAKDFLIHFDTKISAEGTYISAEQVIPHPDWSPSDTVSPFPSGAPNDIGIVILSQDIPSKAKPVAIADADLTLTDFKQAYLAGFGVTLTRNRNNTGILRQVVTELNSQDAATKRFGVGAFGRGACAGDSGGPAYIKVDGEFQLAGATSTGIEIIGTCLGLANNYTDVRLYKDWINQYL